MSAQDAIGAQLVLHEPNEGCRKIDCLDRFSQVGIGFAAGISVMRGVWRQDGSCIDPVFKIRIDVGAMRRQRHQVVCLEYRLLMMDDHSFQRPALLR